MNINADTLQNSFVCPFLSMTSLLWGCAARVLIHLKGVRAGQAVAKGREGGFGRQVGKTKIDYYFLAENE